MSKNTKTEFELDLRDAAGGVLLTAVVRIKKTFPVKLGLWLMCLGAKVGGFGFAVDDDAGDEEEAGDG